MIISGKTSKVLVNGIIHSKLDRNQSKLTKCFASRWFLGKIEKNEVMTLLASVSKPSKSRSVSPANASANFQVNAPLHHAGAPILCLCVHCV